MAAHGPSTVAAVLVAGGSGTRLGATVPKAFCPVGGRTLLAHAAARFLAHADVGPVVVVAPVTLVAEAQAAVPEAIVVAGGATRQRSVHRGLQAVAGELAHVLVHDVARPFVPAAVIDRVVAALRSGADAVIPAVPVTDTIKRVDADGAVLDTLDRSVLRAVQTPQGFARAALEAAHAAASGPSASGPSAALDDASLIEVLGGRVTVVDGAEQSFKITTPWDLALAEALVGTLA